MSAAEQIHYINLIRESSQPLEPLPVQLSAEWEALIPKKNTAVLGGIKYPAASSGVFRSPGELVSPRIKAVLFDLYGTLFISAAGEISAGAAIDSGNAAPGAILCDEMKEYFRIAVNRYHEKTKAAGIAWPEVKAEEIWADYSGKIPDTWELPQRMGRFLEKIGKKAGKHCIGRELALRFELAVNPVFPMPYAEEMLRTLVQNRLKLGIISNAQFFTPLLFDAFFGAPPAELGFDPELLIYSFEEGEAKPSPRLFAKAGDILARNNIKPEEILYIGNDMRNDIVPAAEAGFATALFAGDRRSLRLREDDPACKGKKPDFVINGLRLLR